MSEQRQQTPGDPKTVERLLVQGLGGAKFIVEFYSKRSAALAVTRLMQCHGHHFAVVGEGHDLICSHLAVECLRREGLLPLAESYVHEGGRE